jgi:hypothetical protein
MDEWWHQHGVSPRPHLHAIALIYRTRYIHGSGELYMS